MLVGPRLLRALLTCVACPINLDPEDEVDDGIGRRTEAWSTDPIELESQANAILNDPFTWISDPFRVGTYPPVPSRIARPFRAAHWSRSQLTKLVTALFHAGNLQRARANKILRTYKRHSVHVSSVQETYERLWAVQGLLTQPESARVGDPVSTHQNQEAKVRITCPICQDQDVEMVTDCGHVFCTDCLMLWKELSRTCPKCRNSLKGGHPLYI